VKCSCQVSKNRFDTMCLKRQSRRIYIAVNPSELPEIENLGATGHHGRYDNFGKLNSKSVLVFLYGNPILIAFLNRNVLFMFKM
jgi:hypothetical protein